MSPILYGLLFFAMVLTASIAIISWRRRRIARIADAIAQEDENPMSALEHLAAVIPLLEKMNENNRRLAETTSKWGGAILKSIEIAHKALRR